MKTGSLGTHILFKKISASIFSSLLGNIDLMIFQIAFFLLRKITCLYNRVFPVSVEKYLSRWSQSNIIPTQIKPSPVNP